MANVDKGSREILHKLLDKMIDEEEREAAYSVIVPHFQDGKVVAYGRWVARLFLTTEEYPPPILDDFLP